MDVARNHYDVAIDGIDDRNRNSQNARFRHTEDVELFLVNGNLVIEVELIRYVVGIPALSQARLEFQVPAFCGFCPKIFDVNVQKRILFFECIPHRLSGVIARPAARLPASIN